MWLDSLLQRIGTLATPHQSREKKAPWSCKVPILCSVPCASRVYERFEEYAPSDYATRMEKDVSDRMVTYVGTLT